MKPLFSVIIPVYNAEATLAETLNSVANQSLSSFEVILVNDGSLDGSVGLVKNFRAQHPALDLMLLNQNNLGLGGARNAGISQANGHYCAFIDADDLWTPNKLESCYQYLEQAPECQVLYHPVFAFTANYERKRQAYPIKNLQELLIKGNPLVPSAVIMATDLAQKLHFTEGRKYHGAEDLHLWIRLLHQEIRLHFWPEYLTYYRAQNGMSSQLNQHLRNVFAVLEHFYQENLYPLSALEAAKRRKFLEAGRAFQKLGLHHEANNYYSAADSKSLKLLGLRFLNLLGLRV